MQGWEVDEKRGRGGEGKGDAGEIESGDLVFFFAYNTFFFPFCLYI